MKKKLLTLVVVVASIALTAGIVNAATSHNVTSQFGPEGDIFQVDGTMKMRSTMIGEQGVGGVTYFNGSIINTTTNAGVDNPVTFGDNVRIDGRVFRGATAGTADSMPFIVNDNMEVTGSLTVASLLGTGIVTSDNITDATIATADIADNAITSAKIVDGTITGSDISSTADLSIDTVTTTGNITQAVSAEGALKGWAYVSSGGTLTSGYNATAATNTGNGRYEVTFNFAVNNGSGTPTRAYIATPSGTGGAVAIRLIGAAPHASDPNTVLVWEHDKDENPADGVFMLAIY
ncbi:MAG: hypothetical protein ACNFW9_05795 [Candidatus Kerfeldbacteria bacterium]